MKLLWIKLAWQRECFLYPWDIFHMSTVVPPKMFHSWGQIEVIAKMMLFALLSMNTDLEISGMFR